MNSKELKDMRLTFKKKPGEIVRPFCRRYPVFVQGVTSFLKIFTCHVRFLNFSDKDKRTQSRMAWRYGAPFVSKFFLSVVPFYGLFRKIFFLLFGIICCTVSF